VITNQIDEVIEERLNESEVFFIESPNEWMISAWPYQDETDKPSICKKDYCVCICPIPNIATYGASFEECENTKVCKDYDIKLKTIYEAEAPTWISEKLRDFVSVFKDTQNVPIDITRGNLFTMKIKKGENNEILIVKEQNV
jgi:hypothetical protein